jgi:hypothetical protein
MGRGRGRGFVIVDTMKCTLDVSNVAVELLLEIWSCLQEGKPVRHARLSRLRTFSSDPLVCLCAIG